MRKRLSALLFFMACSSEPTLDVTPPRGANARRLPVTPDVELLPSLTSVDFGYAGANVGDINGDGFEDLVIGDPGQGPRGAGAAYLYLGGAQPMSVSQTLIAPTTYGSLGLDVESAGDVDGDGYDDVLVSDPYAFPIDGERVYVYHGSAGGLLEPPTTLDVPSDGLIGAQGAALGDVDCDGLSDVAIGDGDGGASYEGRLWVFYGADLGIPNPTPLEISPPVVGDIFAYITVGVGDVNGDGCDDFVATDRGDHNNPGVAWLYLGSPGGVILPPITLDSPVRGPNAWFAHFGYQASAAGDINHDGRADVLISASGGTPAGGVYLYLGNARSGLGRPQQVAAGSATASYFGQDMSVGDIDGNGFPELIVHDNSNAWLYRGTARGWSARPDLLLLPPPIDFRRATAASIGDLDLDGRDDLLVSHPDMGVAAEGRAWLVLSGP
jgi:hypothetical protein